MRLSEAILLGSTVLAPKAGGQHFSESQFGCALGMAAVARGCEFVTSRQPAPEHEWRTLGTEGVWGRWVVDRNLAIDHFLRRSDVGIGVRFVAHQLQAQALIGSEKDQDTASLAKG